MRYRLCDGRVRETRSKVSRCLAVRCTHIFLSMLITSMELMLVRVRRLAKDPRFERLPCTHKGSYADDCIAKRVQQHRCYIVATCDKDLKRRIRKIPGVPIMYIAERKYQVERMPEANAAKHKK